MKIKLVLLFLFGMSSGSFGQEFQPIIKADTTIWYVAHQQLAGNFIDTLFAKEEVDGWTELWWRGAYGYNQLTSCGKAKASLNNDSLWYIPQNDTIPKLVFNLNLAKGDTFELYNSIVDSVYVLYGRKIIEFKEDTQWDEKLRFIEGVGPNNSCIYAGGFGILHPLVVCQFENYSKIYSSPNSHFKDCSLLSTGIQKLQESDIKVFPNPFVGQLNISFSNDKSRQVNLMDINGKTLYVQICTTDYLNINTFNLKKGIYFLQIKENGKSISFKICKK
ncbi:MAG: T9SS type A sorting domain-containing protein [Draconibacterium sp.]